MVEPRRKSPDRKRPTVGGAVLHKTTDLSLSLLWPRHSGFLPENPKDCYELIHKHLMEGVKNSSGKNLYLYAPDRHSRESGNPGCQPAVKTSDSKKSLKPGFPLSRERRQLCFEEPVCNDVMLDKKKIIGGALRLTKQAILYQGTVQLGGLMDKES